MTAYLSGAAPTAAYELAAGPAACLWREKWKNVMARDQARIRPFLEKLAELWEKSPDQRFGQLIMNLCRPGDGSLGFLDPWEWEEDYWLKLIEEAEITFARYRNPLFEDG